MPENRGPQLAALTIALLILSVTAVSVRCYVRLRLVKSFAYDDWLIVATLLFYTIYCTFVLIGVHYGTGQHVDDLTAHNYSEAMKAWFICEIFYCFSSTFTKFAAGTLLLRLTMKTLHIRIIWFIMTLASLLGLAFFISILAQCQPIPFFWSSTRDPADGHCISTSVLQGISYAHAAVASVGDWTFGILPAFLVKDLQMNVRTKVSVFLILALANIGSIATLIRIKAINEIGKSQDFLFVTVDLAIWSSVEVGLATIAVSIATYRPLFRSFFHLTGGGSNSRRGHNSAYIRHEGPNETIDLGERERERKAGLSQTSETEIFPRTVSGRNTV